MVLLSACTAQPESQFGRNLSISFVRLKNSPRASEADVAQNKYYLLSERQHRLGRKERENTMVIKLGTVENSQWATQRACSHHVIVASGWQNKSGEMHGHRNKKLCALLKYAPSFLTATSSLQPRAAASREHAPHTEPQDPHSVSRLGSAVGRPHDGL